MLSRIGSGAAACLALLTGCSALRAPDPLPGQHLTREQFNNGDLAGATDVWPFTVDSGTLSCVEFVRESDGRMQPAVVFTTESGTQYAINQTAANQGIYSDFADIWAFHPNTKRHKNATVLIQEGLQLCPNYTE
jgi:hypothetical protein